MIFCRLAEWCILTEKLTIAATRLYSVQEALGRLQIYCPHLAGLSYLPFCQLIFRSHDGALLLPLILSPHWN